MITHSNLFFVSRLEKRSPLRPSTGFRSFRRPCLSWSAHEGKAWRIAGVCREPPTILCFVSYFFVARWGAPPSAGLRCPLFSDCLSSVPSPFVKSRDTRRREKTSWLDNTRDLGNLEKLSANMCLRRHDFQEQSSRFRIMSFDRWRDIL